MIKFDKIKLISRLEYAEIMAQFKSSVESHPNQR